MKLSSSATSAPIDLDALVGALPILADRWRKLRFATNGVLDESNHVHTGLNVTSGTHPFQDAHYGVRLRAPEGTAEFTVEVIEDSTERLRFRVASDGQETEVALHHPLRPTAIDTSSTVDTGTEWPTGGSARIETRTDFAGAHPHFALTARHRLFRGKGEVVVDASNRAEWTIRLSVYARGRSLARPLVAIASPLVRRRIQRAVDESLAKTARNVSSFNSELAHEVGGPPTSERIADYAMRKFFESLA